MPARCNKVPSLVLPNGRGEVSALIYGVNDDERFPEDPMHLARPSFIVVFYVCEFVLSPLLEIPDDVREVSVKGLASRRAFR